MVIYDSGDSDLLIQSLTENLESAKAVLDRIHQGTQHLNTSDLKGLPSTNFCISDVKLPNTAEEFISQYSLTTKR